MSKHIKNWVGVTVKHGCVLVEGTASERKKGEPDNNEVWLALSKSEVQWLANELDRALNELHAASKVTP